MHIELLVIQTLFCHVKDRTLVLSYTYTKIGTWKYETGKTENVSLSFKVDQVSISLVAAPGNMQFKLIILVVQV